MSNSTEHSDDGDLPQALPVADVRWIVRLLGNLIVVPGNAVAKRRYLLTELAKLVSADVWIWAHSRWKPDGDVIAFSVLDEGWTDERQKVVFMEASFDPDVSRMIYARLIRERHMTRTRDQLASDAEWYGLPFVRDRYPEMGLDHFVITTYPIAPGVMSGIGLHRRTGKPAFTPRERCIVHVVTSEIDWLHRAETNIPAAAQVLPLSTRQREVMLLLLEGDSRKQIARRLGLSEHTVGDYMKALYKHFDVSSRGELLAHFMSGGGPGGAAP